VGEADVCGALQLAYEEDRARLGRPVLVAGGGGGAVTDKIRPIITIEAQLWCAWLLKKANADVLIFIQIIYKMAVY
jgi:hypothetical protein